MPRVGPADGPSATRSLELQGLQVLAERPAQVVALQRELDGGLQEAELVAGVVADALEAVAEQRALLLLSWRRPFVSWISPPSSRGVVSSASKMSGVRM